jgi:hypothetical protein
MRSTKLTPKTLEKLKYYVLGSFKNFCHIVWSNEWFDMDFHGPLCDFLQDGNSEDKQIIMPRSHLKTTIVTQLYSIWRALNNPEIRILIVQNSEANAIKTVRGIRQILEDNGQIQALFSELIPTNKRKVKWTDSEVTLVRKGSFREPTWEAAGTNSNVVSKHYDLIIEDDTCAPRKDEMRGGGSSLEHMEIMPSRDEIEKAVGFHKLTMPLAVDLKNFQRLFVGTRWAPYDTISYILESESSPKDDAGNEVRFYDTFDVKAIDDVGNPRYKRMDHKGLNSLKKNLGNYMFHMLYLNTPLDSSHMKFKPGNIKYFTHVPVAGGTDFVLDLEEVDKDPVVTIDPADPPTGKKDQCNSAVVCAVDSEKGLFVLDYKAGHFTEKEIIEASFIMADQFDAFVIRIETDRYPHMIASFQIAKRKHMAARFNQGLPKKTYSIQGVKSKGRNKETRIMRLAPIADYGLLFLRRHMTELEKEMFTFPNGATNDILDALAYQVDGTMRIPSYETPIEPVVLPANTISFEEIMGSVNNRVRSAGNSYDSLFANQRGDSQLSLSRWN